MQTKICFWIYSRFSLNKAKQNNWHFSSSIDKKHCNRTHYFGCNSHLFMNQTTQLVLYVDVACSQWRQNKIRPHLCVYVLLSQNLQILQFLLLTPINTQNKSSNAIKDFKIDHRRHFQLLKYLHKPSDQHSNLCDFLNKEQRRCLRWHTRVLHSTLAAILDGEKSTFLPEVISR